MGLCESVLIFFVHHIYMLWTSAVCRTISMPEREHFRDNVAKFKAYFNTILAFSVCDSRKYTYFFPSYLLIPPKPGSGLYKTFSQQLPELASTEVHPFWADSSSECTHEEDLARKRHWRADDDIMGTLRTIAQKYLGTHNFHNFTVGRDFSDRSTIRFMKSIEVSFWSSFCGSILNGRVDRRSCCIRRNGMDRRFVPWAEFYVASGELHRVNFAPIVT